MQPTSIGLRFGSVRELRITRRPDFKSREISLNDLWIKASLLGEHENPDPKAIEKLWTKKLEKRVVERMVNDERQQLFDRWSGTVQKNTVEEIKKKAADDEKMALTAQLAELGHLPEEINQEAQQRLRELVNKQVTSFQVDGKYYIAQNTENPTKVPHAPQMQESLTMLEGFLRKMEGILGKIEGLTGLEIIPVKSQRISPQKADADVIHQIRQTAEERYPNNKVKKQAYLEKQYQRFVDSLKAESEYRCQTVPVAYFVNSAGEIEY